jgi:peptide-methionine (S)-S-oxide reductase
MKGFAIGAAALAAAVMFVATPGASQQVPAPRAAIAEGKAPQVAVLAGGCFWGLEAVFEHVKGVRQVVSGYAGGSAADARYSAVSYGGTRHAEAVRIVYDPAVVSYGDLLRIYFSVAHDPTQLNRQGPDTGTSYRSAIFPQNAAQRKAAAAYIAQLGKAGVYKKPIVTRLESGIFYPAEAHHQDFMKKNPMHPYIVMHDRPKVAALKRMFADRFKA